MDALILHHHDPSPFAEKIRLVFGIKGLPWQSVQTAMVMPRPELMALTGGYRKIPVLQIGAEVICDTRLIARELEARFPQHSIFPQGSQGLCMAIGAWSDRNFFDPGAGLAMGLNKSLIPKEVIDDRKGFFNFMDFDRLEADIPHLFTQFRVMLERVNGMLEDGRRYVLGEQISWADINAYFPVWMARTNFGEAARVLNEWPMLLAWEQRMAAVGHGQRKEMTASEALHIARDTQHAVVPFCVADDALKLAPGMEVEVTPTDYGCIPVRGELLRLEIDRVVLRRTTQQTGEVAVHFPRSGYSVTRL
jgi:glutathione S-transferase